MQSQTGCLLTTFAPYPFILPRPLSLSFLRPPATMRWFNGNYSEMERNEKSRVHWLFVKPYAFKLEKAKLQLGHTHPLALLKGHLLFRQCKHCISFACSGVFNNCNTFTTYNNEGQSSWFIFVIPYFVFLISDFEISGEFISSAKKNLFKVTEHPRLEQEQISEFH